MPHLSVPRQFPLLARSSPGRLAPVLLVPVLLAAALLLPARPALAAPASKAEMEVYTSLAALNVCIARAAGVEFDLAVGVAAETISQWIQGTHQGGIAPVSPTALSLEDLRKGSINSAVLGAAELCPDQVPEAVLRDVQQAVNAAAPETPSRP
ncbi:MAG: cAMP phosphodiesterase [Synechococcaceae cyanobacterium]